MNSSTPTAEPTPLRCTRCEYNLTGLLPSGSCPECGHRVDDSMRERGLWTVARLVRLRRISIALLVGAVVLTPMALVLALEIARSRLIPNPPRFLIEGCAVITILVHAGCIAFGAIGGTFASSRQSYQMRLGISIGLSSVLVVAACCLAAAFTGSRPLQRAFEDWGFVASGAVRTAGIALTLFWLTRGLRQTRLADAAGTRVLSAFLVGYPAAWAVFLSALILPLSRRWLTSSGGWQLVGSLLALDALALLVIAAIATLLVVSASYNAEIRAARRADSGAL